MNLLRRVEPDDAAVLAAPPVDRLVWAPARWPWLKPAAAAGAVVAVVVGVALRFVVRGGLWLDEALTVNIARLPLTQTRWVRARERRRS